MIIIDNIDDIKLYQDRVPGATEDDLAIKGSKYSLSTIDSVYQVMKNMHGWQTTNSEINSKVSKLNLKADDIGKIKAYLKSTGKINYQYVMTGRKAAGSGRFTVYANGKRYL